MPVFWGCLTAPLQSAIRKPGGEAVAVVTLSFNWNLISAPPRVLDYVVLHELCHRREMNHLERFWLLVESIMPEYRDYKKWLKDNGNSFSGFLPLTNVICLFILSYLDKIFLK